MDIIEKAKDFFDGTPEVKRDDNGVFVRAGGNEYRAPSLGDLEAKLRDLSEAEGDEGSGSIHDALVAVQNERQREAGV
ncbi:MAG: hypothetical protein WEB00_06630 [Dehalococcoidia bacterium]